MKKFLVAGFIIFMLAAGPVRAVSMNGIGLYGNLAGNGTGAGGGLGLTLRYGSFPVIGLEWNMRQDASEFGISLDGWLLNQSLSDRLNFYLGIGGYAAIRGGTPSNTINFGGRIPLGLQFYPAEPFEVFLEVSPMIIFVPVLDWTVSARLGFRILY